MVLPAPPPHFYSLTSGLNFGVHLSVTSIGSDAFGRCSKLTAVTVDALNPSYCSVDGVLFDKNQFTLVQYPGGKSGSYTIPNSATSIADYAFDLCSNLTSVTIPDSVTSIGSSAFIYCSSLTTVTIPSNVTSIGSSAFCWCSSLTSVTIPNSVTSIGSFVFDGCNNLTSVTIPNSVTSIGSYVFKDCSNLTSVTIPNSVTSIGSYVFDGCSSLTGVAIPDSVTSIGMAAFASCSSLTSITIPNGVTSIGSYAFSGCSKLSSAVFMGNAPTIGSSVFASTASGFTVSFYNDKTGFTSPWNGYQTVNMGPSPIASWLLSKGFAYNADLKSAPNHDGVPLLMAYALNLDPTRNQSGSLPKLVFDGNNLNYTYYAGNADVTYTVQTSTDLQTWSTEGVTVSSPDANNFRTATLPVTGTRRFLRLVVSH